MVKESLNHIHTQHNLILERESNKITKYILLQLQWMHHGLHVQQMRRWLMGKGAIYLQNTLEQKCIEFCENQGPISLTDLTNFSYYLNLSTLSILTNVKIKATYMHSISKQPCTWNVNYRHNLLIFINSQMRNCLSPPRSLVKIRTGKEKHIFSSQWKFLFFFPQSFEIKLAKSSMSIHVYLMLFHLSYSSDMLMITWVCFLCTIILQILSIL